MKACIGQGLCLWNAKTMETVQEGQSPNLFDYWADTSLPFFLLLKSSFRREPWSSGYGWRLRFKRSWVEIPAPYTGWTFYTLICCKNCFVCLKRPKINEKEAGVGPFFKKEFHVGGGKITVYLNFLSWKIYLISEHFVDVISVVSMRSWDQYYIKLFEVTEMYRTVGNSRSLF